MSAKHRNKVAFERLLRRVTEIPKASNAQLNRKLAKATVEHIQSNFERRSTPGGRKWAPRTRNYPWPTLERTKGTGLRTEFTMKNVKANSQSFKIVGLPPTFTFHQEGTKNKDGSKRMPARPMAPKKQLPKRLKAAFDDIVKAHVVSWMKRRK